MTRSTATVLVLIAVCISVLGFVAFGVDASRSSSDAVSVDTQRADEALRLRLSLDKESDTSSKDELDLAPRYTPVAGLIIYAFDPVGGRLVSFDASSPGTLLTNTLLTGLENSETLYGMDFRPADGRLYAIATSGFPTRSRLVTVDVSTGVVTPVHPTNTVATPIDSFYGFEVNPATDLIRNVGNNELNRRVNPTNGLVAANDSALRYATGDINAGVNPTIAHIANTISTTSATTTTYGVDVNTNSLVRIGSPNSVDSASSGEITTIGSLGVNPTLFGAMDIQPGATTAYASFFIASEPYLAIIDLTTGAASIVGRIGGPEIEAIDGLSIPVGPLVLPSPTPSPTPTQTPFPTPTPFPTATPTPVPANASIIRVGTVATTPGATVTVPFDLLARGGERTVKFSFRYNAAALALVSIDLSNGVPAGATLTTDLSGASEGFVGINIDTSGFVVGTRRLMTATFSVRLNSLVGYYPITLAPVPIPFEIRDGSGNSLPIWFEPGNVVAVLTAAGVDVSGRVMTPDGRGLRNAAVTITGIDGTRRVVTTSSFGYYRFNDVEAGGTYVVGVESKRYSFTSRVLNVQDTLTEINFLGN